MQMFVNDLILNACVKTTEMFICEKILTTSGKKITSNPYTNGHTLLSAVYIDQYYFIEFENKKKHLKLLYE
jgi:hypothetical protein